MKGRILVVLMIGLLCLSGSVGHAQNAIKSTSYLLNQFSTNEGLSQSNVFQIIRDQEGFIWIATEDGLNRFDGYEFIVYKNDPKNTSSLSDNFTRCITEDSKSRLWVGTNQGGLCKYDKELDNFKTYKYDPTDTSSLSQNTVSTIFEASDGQLWIGTYWGLNIFDTNNETFKNILNYNDNPSGLIQNKIYGIIENDNNEIWVGTRGGISIFDNSGMIIRNYQHTDESGLGKGAVTNMAVDFDQNIWVSVDQEGLYRFNQRTKNFRKFEPDSAKEGSIANLLIRSLYVDSKGILWVGMDGYGFQQFDPKREAFKTVFKNSNLLPHEQIKTYEIYEDTNHNIWFGSYGHGIYVHNESSNNFKQYKRDYFDANSLSHNSVLSLSKGENSTIWIGTDGGGLDCYFPKEQRYIHHKTNLSDGTSISGNVIKSLLFDSKENLWVGTFNTGLNVLKKGSSVFQRLNSENSPLSSNNVWSIMEDSNQKIWIGTLDSGLDRYDPATNNWKNYSSLYEDPSTLSGNDISCLMEDNQQNIWVGTAGAGINILDQKTNKFKREKHDKNDPNSISHNAIRHMYQSSDGTIWVGTTNGLNRFDNATKKFTRYFEKDGLPSSLIKGIIEDRSGTVWMGTNNGICSLDPKTDQIVSYNVSDGLQGKEFNNGALMSTADGTIYMGGKAGFNSFVPQEIIDNETEPEVLFTKFLLFNKPVEINTKSILNKAISQLDSIEFRPDDYVFSIEFSANEYTFPKENLFQYKLLGFDDSWSPASLSRSATYMHLPAGEYDFLVRVTNNSGNWSSKTGKIHISVLSPWWQTRLARLLFIVIFIMIVFAMIRIRTSYLQEQRAILKKLVRQRTKELHEKNERITAQAEELHTFNDALNHLIANLERTVEERTQELVEKNKVMSDFAFLNAHNLRAPVANIKGLVHIFNFDIDWEEKTQIIENIKGQVEKVDEVLLEINERLKLDDMEKRKKEAAKSEDQD